MNLITLLGLCAGFLTTIAFLPQAIKIWKLKEAKEISLLTFVTMSLGVLLWLIYGLFISDIAIILSNAVTLALAITILYFKVKFK